MGFEEIDRDTRMWGMLCHLSGLAVLTGFPCGNILGPLVIWLVKREEHSYIDEQGKEALNFQLSMTIYMSVLGVLIFVTFIFILPLFIFVPLLLIVFIMQLVLTVLGAVRANDGISYRYPLTIRFFQ